MQSVVADVSLEGLTFNGRLFHAPMEPSEYAAILRAPARIVEPMTPAPYGHRNNQIHVFDDFGLYLIEHHAKRLVDAVVFVLWLEECAFKPAREFSGILTVGGQRFFPGMAAKDLLAGAIASEGPILGLWAARKDGISICLRGTGTRSRSGRRSKRVRFVDVSVCFSSANEIGKDASASGALP